MLTLSNESLTVTILDPVADQERFGPRYCTGGYIYQVEDSRHGKLLSGPTYPDSFNWFDGQGIPDAFNLGPLREPASDSTVALVIGVGMCDLQANVVRQYCAWYVQQEPSALRFTTAQSFQSFALDLERRVSLSGRTVRSHTRVRNTGRAAIPIRWYPHPFYPHPEGDELCRFNIPVGMPEGASYELAESGYIRRRGWPWSEGHFQALDHAGGASLVVHQRHPVLGMVGATCSYTPGFFPIWGNAATFSWEPYYERTLAGGQETSWWIDYDF